MTDWKDYVFPQFQCFYGERAVKGMDDMIENIQPGIIKSNVNKLTGYADNSFRVGNSKTFKKISDDFNDTVGEKYEKIQTYLLQSMQIIDDVRNLMLKDLDAQIAAKAEYERFKKNNESDYWIEVTNKDGSVSKKFEEEALERDAKAAADAVWDNEKSAVWN